jgi:putative DNA primase/helicase
MGVNITAIAGDGKAPRYQWKQDVDTRQDYERLKRLPWGGYTTKDGTVVPPAGRVGILHSNAVGQWRCFDIDACKDSEGNKLPVSDNIVRSLLLALGLPADYAWCMRSGSGAGWHVYIRCEDALPAGLTESTKEKGVFVGIPHIPGDFEHIELRWHGVQSVPAFASVDDVPDEPPALVSSEQVIRAFHAIAQKPAPPAPPAPPAQKPHTNANGAHPYIKRAVEGKLEDACEQLRLAADGQRHTTRLAMGKLVGGLLHYGTITESEAIEALYNARIPEGDTRKERKAIEDGIAAGKAEPITVEVPAAGPGQRQQPTRAHAPAQAGEDGSTPAVSLADNPPLIDLHLVGDCAQSGDQGDARLLQALYPDTLVYDVREKCWYVWAGHYWRKDTVGLVRRLLAGHVLAQYLMAAAQFHAKVVNLEDPKDDIEKEELKKAKAALEGCHGKIKKLNQTGGTKNAITFAECYLPFEGEWDAQPYKLACQNGVIDLKTGKLEPGKPADYIRTATPLDYDPNAECPRWEQFISEILPDQETAAYLHRLLGYGISGLTIEHILPVLWGPGGRNGKDVLMRSVQTAMGAAAATVHPDIVMSQDRRSGAAEPHKVALQGLRIGFANETSEGARLNEEQVKTLTGGGDITARGLHEMLRTFTPTHLLFLVTNWLPRASSEDTALWERLRVIRFTQRFVDNPASEGEHPQDSLLAEKLAAERKGILRWLVTGFLAYQQFGDAPPKSVRLETEAMREENDVIGAFIADCCVVKANASVKAKDLYEEYKQWCTDNGNKPFSGTRFGKKMSARFQKKRTEEGMTYQGVGVLAETSTLHSAHQPYIDDLPHSSGGYVAEGRDGNVGSVGLGKSFELNPHMREKVCTNPTDPTFQETPNKDLPHSNGGKEQCRVEDGGDNHTPDPEDEETSSTTFPDGNGDIRVGANEQCRVEDGGEGSATPTRQEAAADRYRDEDYRLALLARLVTADTEREERSRLYQLETSELEALVYSALVGEGKGEEARKLADMSSEPTAMHAFVDALLETIETA